MGVEVQAWGHLGMAPFAALGDTEAGGQSPAVLDQGYDLLCIPNATCEGMARPFPPCQDPPRPLTSLFSFPRSPPGQHWGLADPQLRCPPDSPSPPLGPWRTLLLLRSPQHRTGLSEGEPGIGQTALPPLPPPSVANWGLVTVRVMKGWQNLHWSCRDGFREQLCCWYQDPTALGRVEVDGITAGTKEALGISAGKGQVNPKPAAN